MRCRTRQCVRCQAEVIISSLGIDVGQAHVAGRPTQIRITYSGSKVFAVSTYRPSIIERTADAHPGNHDVYVHAEGEHAAARLTNGALHLAMLRWKRSCDTIIRLATAWVRCKLAFVTTRTNSNSAVTHPACVSSCWRRVRSAAEQRLRLRPYSRKTNMNKKN